MNTQNLTSIYKFQILKTLILLESYFFEVIWGDSHPIEFYIKADYELQDIKVKFNINYLKYKKRAISPQNSLYYNL